MTNQTPATMTPSEIDTALAEIWTRRNREATYLASERSVARRYGAESRYGIEAAERAEKHAANIQALTAEAAPFTAEFVVRGGWNRYYLVNNTGGHIHREMSCSTCFDTTQFGWLPELSDCDETDMVAEYGELACTVCFPSAPSMKGYADGTSAIARYTAAEKAAKAAEKAAKAADKATKAIAAPDGSPLKVDGDTIRTIIAAERKLSDVVQSFGFYGETHPSDFAGQARILIEALLARGVEAAKVDGIVTRATKKATKEGGAHTLSLTV